MRFRGTKNDSWNTVPFGCQSFFSFGCIFLSFFAARERNGHRGRPDPRRRRKQRAALELCGKGRVPVLRRIQPGLAQPHSAPTAGNCVPGPARRDRPQTGISRQMIVADGATLRTRAVMHPQTSIAVAHAILHERGLFCGLRRIQTSYLAGFWSRRAALLFTASTLEASTPAFAAFQEAPSIRHSSTPVGGPR